MGYKEEKITNEAIIAIIQQLEELATIQIDACFTELESLSKMRTGIDTRIKDIQKSIAEFQKKCPHQHWKFLCNSHNGRIYKCEICRKTESR